MNDHTDAKPVTAADPAGYVEATVRADGRLAALRIDPHAMYDLTAAELATACIEAIQRASSACAGPARAA
ncbi:YbaB/EbfC family nucleoid-associated protein [Micromonospora sp. URMC 103]|uniref:YbaB/EbfC family nucleoid-associated protein n=1 Tax=Micromonospora sp. URMC 103 TaxID=3423406 RepID=UPI003F1AE0EA